jgi:hypothetical protein
MQASWSRSAPHWTLSPRVDIERDKTNDHRAPHEGYEEKHDIAHLTFHYEVRSGATARCLRALALATSANERGLVASIGIAGMSRVGDLVSLVSRRARRRFFGGAGPASAIGASSHARREVSRFVKEGRQRGRFARSSGSHAIGKLRPKAGPGGVQWLDSSERIAHRRFG